MPMMRHFIELKYMKTNTFAAIDLPYGNKQWCMTVMLPHKGKSADDVIDYLAKNGIAFTKQFSRHDIDLKLPRFETESTTEDLIGTLKNMGINRVFGNKAEMPNMCDTAVYISNMLQKARIKVDESGSEAAAVTYAEYALDMCIDEEEPEPPIIFHANRPFVYAIREASTGVILFVGKFTGK